MDTTNDPRSEDPPSVLGGVVGGARSRSEVEPVGAPAASCLVPPPHSPPVLVPGAAAAPHPAPTAPSTGGALGNLFTVLDIYAVPPPPPPITRSHVEAQVQRLTCAQIREELQSRFGVTARSRDVKATLVDMLASARLLAAVGSSPVHTPSHWRSWRPKQPRRRGFSRPSATDTSGARRPGRANLLARRGAMRTSHTDRWCGQSRAGPSPPTAAAVQRSPHRG